MREHARPHKADHSKKAEVLAPAGSYESMKAAVHAGADAVYIGGSRFGARAYADNPDEAQLMAAIDYVHLHNRRIYLTVNTLFKESELADLPAYLAPYYRQGLDGVIVQDLGALSLIRQAFPDLSVHASTQMTVTGPYAARALKDLGVVRVVPARELTLEEASAIRREAGVEVECFVHGALCYCYSGQCLLSSLIGGRSGNRGRCAQPCRLPYEARRSGRRIFAPGDRYLLSLKDLCTVTQLPDLLDAGIDSLKIEGRMKSPRYTAGVVSIYRKYVDLYAEKGRSGFHVDPADIQALKDLFDRGGFTDGYFKQQNGRDMVVLKEKPAFREGNQELYAALDAAYVESGLQEPIRGKAILAKDRAAVLELACGSVCCRVEGDVPQPAQSHPITDQALRKQLTKTGNSPFYFPTPDALEIQIEGDLFLPVQALNRMRRSGLEALEMEILTPYRREGKDHADRPASVPHMQTTHPLPPSAGPAPALHVLIQSAGQLGAALRFPQASRIYLESALWTEQALPGAVRACHDAGKECYLALPHVFRARAARHFDANQAVLAQSGLDGFLARTLDGLCYCREYFRDLPVVADAGLYAWNHRASDLLSRLGAASQTAAWELNSRELEEAGCEGKEMVVYGYLPVMVTAQCVRQTVEGCGQKPELLHLKDRTGKELPVQNLCRFCYNLLYNPLPLSLLGQSAILSRLGPAAYRVQLTIETAEASREILEAFSARPAGSPHPGKSAGSSPLGKPAHPATPAPLRDITRGHLKRGVE